MTLQDLIVYLNGYPNVILQYFVAIIVIALIGLLLVNHKNYNKPIAYVYTLIIYAICIPGLFSIILVLYNFFFLKRNLLELNLITHFLPLLAMFLTLLIVKKTVDTATIPGFNKLLSLFTVLIITFVLTYIIQKVFIGVFFIGSIQTFGVFIVFLLVGIKLSWNRMMR